MGDSHLYGLMPRPKGGGWRKEVKIREKRGDCHRLGVFVAKREEMGTVTFWEFWWLRRRGATVVRWSLWGDQ
jgi:hypothetical protein